MSRLTYAAVPLLTGLIALVGCPSDDVPADTDNNASSTGDLTTSGPPPLTTTDPDSSGGPDTGATTEVPMTCDPDCGAGMCCINGTCFGEPDPVCEAGCSALEMCLCPAGSDPCDCDAECVTCGIEEPSYDPCLEVECPAGSVCIVDDPMAPTFGWCAVQGCGEDACACPVPPMGSEALNACDPFTGDDGNGSCYLDCGGGEACPEGMLCRPLDGVSACVWGGDDIESDCCISNGSQGCDDMTCQDAVCAADPFCCSNMWDQICADQAPQLCPELCMSDVPVEPQYGDCINGNVCEVPTQCINGGDFGWCGTVNCADDTPCQPPPATGDAPAVCLPINDMTDACVLDCSMGQTCPDGMICANDQFCAWEMIVPPVPLPPGYGDCVDNPQTTCLPTEDACLVDAMATAGACTQTGCMMDADCEMAPPTGTAIVTCGDLGTGNTCYLDCANAEVCPDGTACTAVGAGMACLWADQGFALNEDFELGLFRPGWSLIDVDGQMPDANVAFVTDAFVVSDQLEAGVNFSAISTSWYAPAGQSDDWMITPLVTLGAASMLSWDARAPDPAFPDGYEVYVSTAMPVVADFMLNPTIFSVVGEADVFTPHVVDLAAAGYANQDVYIAFRNPSTDQFLLLIDNVQITQ